MEKDINNNNYVKNQNPYNKYKQYIGNDVLKYYYQFIHLKNLYRQGWLKYENKTTKEAAFVKEVDKLEPILQSIAYGVKPKDYFKDEVITIPCLRKVLNDAYNLSNIE